MNNFKIRILDQYWISKDPKDESDLCSHGVIRLEIGNEIISDSSDVDWTVSTAGLMLLRSLNSDHSVEDTYPMIQHCGQLGMIGCPISIDWSVTHSDNTVTIRDVKKLMSTNSIDSIKFENIDAKIERRKYIREVVRFCDDIRSFTHQTPRNFENDIDRNEWDSFWSEFDKLLEKNRIELKNNYTQD